MRAVTDLNRYEVKFWIPNRLIPRIREYIKPFTILDPHIQRNGQKHYTVRSIYFDTSGLDFYYEKLDGLKVRKKLRIRGYDNKDGYAFLEIKRKYGNTVFKERTKLPYSIVEQIINTPDLSSHQSVQDNHNTLLVSGKFLYNLIKKNLAATLLVIYEREPYVDTEDENIRVTIDKNVRCRYQPDLKDLFNGADLESVTNKYSILELKYNDSMPKWMRKMVGELKIRHESISKYCIGIDATKMRG